MLPALPPGLPATTFLPRKIVEITDRTDRMAADGIEFRGRIYDSIIDTIGATPLVRLSRLAALAYSVHGDGRPDARHRIVHLDPGQRSERPFFLSRH